MHVVYMCRHAFQYFQFVQRSLIGDNFDHGRGSWCRFIWHEDGGPLAGNHRQPVYLIYKLSKFSNVFEKTRTTYY